MMKHFLVALLTGLTFTANAQTASTQLKSRTTQEKPRQSKADHWVDSVFNSLSHEERIAQLIMIRMHSNLGQDHINSVLNDVRVNKIGGMVTFQGGPVRQAMLINRYQAASKTPLLIATDGEWGLGMRFVDSVIAFPRNLMLGAVQDSALIYEVGKAIGEQCKRMGIQYNFAPVLDVNNNPNNPVINDRSFGEDKYQVARLGIAMIKGMQDAGVMACAKHFPGHGDTDVDSHYDLPSINKTLSQLDSLELYPFQRAIDAGVGSVMIGHLYLPAIDKKANTPSSISYKTVTDLLQKRMGFDGLIVTDALEMKGISKYYDHGQESLQSLLAGNDLMELPSTAKGSIAAIAAAIKKGTISRAEVYRRVKKVLRAKYDLGLAELQPIDPANITEDLNAAVLPLRRRISEEAITVLRNDNHLLPLPVTIGNKKLAIVAVGVDGGNNTFIDAVRSHRADVDAYVFSPRQSEAQVNAMVKRLKAQYDAVIIAVQNYSRRPANNYGINAAERLIVNQLQEEMPAATVTFGNPYAIRYFCDAPTIIAAYEDDSLTHKAAADVIFGKLDPKGKLPVTVCANFKFGAGLASVKPVERPSQLEAASPESVGMNGNVLNRIDSLAYDMIQKGAAPGCQVLAMKDGKMVYRKSFGFYDYSQKEPVTDSSVYDLASVTKICATTLSVMRLYDEGKLSLDSTLGTYLPWVRGSDKEKLVIRDVLMHQAGLVAYIPFYRGTLYDNGWPDTLLFAAHLDSIHSLRVAENLYMTPQYNDTMFQIILDSKLIPAGSRYIYSDNDFIFLGKIVESITGKRLDHYVRETFYEPLGLRTMGFEPRSHLPLSQLVPTEFENNFRVQLIRGDVHDPGAAMFGGIAGHAGLFSNATDLGVLMQMLLNGGTYNGKSYIHPETIQMFSAYHSNISRRGLGFDKPEKDNASRDEPYPCKSASPLTYGHTGFTGTCVWIDPQYKLAFIFLSNRVCPNGGANTKLYSLNVRSNIMETLYDAMQ
ncbi:glycoside hydrolase family 3 N-terminal domain-containing protein [Chitinophaga sp. GCM10012297]|uniref:beta-N-acetylhexosaminidase n=1 Tax=Chitinophaga chungangae TaxID=2821488 RepID=A0ABS3YE92_9BACT|nr:glycoside hydrolase family 3 N-terminal domain-containing protein [Chitinophaga chungangae]MBO9152785.1 serine hydrolase [Chitinophaga chungangae]